MTDINSSDWKQLDADNTNPSPNGVSGGYAPSTVAPILRAIRGAIKRDFVARNPIYTTTGTANAYVLTFEQAPAAYHKGQIFHFWSDRNNTGAATLNVNSLGAKSILSQHGSALTANQIKASKTVQVVYNGTSFELLNVSTQDPTFLGTVTANSFAGDGSALTGLNASNLTSGILPNARISGSYDGMDTLTSNRIRLLSTTDASETSTGHAFQVGPDNNLNVIIDNNEVIFRNNGALATVSIVGSSVYFSSEDLRAGGNTIWHAGNDGAGSGLDADLLDGLQATNFVQTTRTVTAGNGLSGGGALSANIALALGTPGTLTGTTTNAVTATSHTHSIELSATQVRGFLGYTPADAADSIIAGNGLSGGGVLSTSRTITMGTPGSITNSTTNAVTTTSHTHALGFTAAEVYTGSSVGYAAFPVGTVISARSTSTNRNNSRAISLDADDTRFSSTGSGAELAGTWRARGLVNSGDHIFQRTA